MNNKVVASKEKEHSKAQFAPSLNSVSDDSSTTYADIVKGTHQRNTQDHTNSVPNGKLYDTFSSLKTKAINQKTNTKNAT